MGKEKGRKQPHRGRRKKGGVISGIILVIALIVFCVSGFNLLKYGKATLQEEVNIEKSVSWQ